MKQAFTVYLAGPIANCTDEEAGEWRKKVTEALQSLKGSDGIEVTVLDPFAFDCRDKEREQSYVVVAMDKEMIRKSDLVLANVWKTGTGTAMEIMFSNMIGVPVAVIYTGPSPWITEHCRWQLDDLDGAISWLTDSLRHGGF